jgi:hypothetical protein
LRNYFLLFPALAVFSLFLFFSFPKFADVAQYHTWLLSKVPNSQPIYLLTLLPGYPLLNFSAVTAIYIFLSHRMFELTASLRDALIPHDDDALLGRNLVTMSLGAAALWGIGFVVKEGAKAL